MRFCSLAQCGLLLCFLASSSGSFYRSNGESQGDSLLPKAARQSEGSCIESSYLLKFSDGEQWTKFLKQNSPYICYVKQRAVLKDFIYAKGHQSGNLSPNFIKACRKIDKDVHKAIETVEDVKAKRYSLLFFFTAANLVRDKKQVSDDVISELLWLAAMGAWTSGRIGSLDWAAGLEKEVPGLITCAVESFAYAVFKRKDFALADFIHSRVLQGIFAENEDVGIQLAKLFVCLIKSTPVDKWIAVQTWFVVVSIKDRPGKEGALPPFPALAQTCVWMTWSRRKRQNLAVSHSRGPLVSRVASSPAVRQSEGKYCIESSSDLLRTYDVEEWRRFLKEINGKKCFINGKSVLGDHTKDSERSPLRRNFDDACRTIEKDFFQTEKAGRGGVKVNRYSLLFFFTAVNLVRSKRRDSGNLVSSLLDLAARGAWDSGPTGPLDWAAGLERDVPGLTSCIVESFAHSVIEMNDRGLTRFFFSNVIKNLFKNRDVGTQLAQFFVCMIQSTTVDKWIAVQNWFSAISNRLNSGRPGALPPLPAAAQSCIGKTKIKNTRLLSLVSDSRQTVVINPVVSTGQYSPACINMLTQDPRTTKDADLSVTTWILQMFRDPCQSECETFAGVATKSTISSLESMSSANGRCDSLLANADSYAIMKYLTYFKVEKGYTGIMKPRNLNFKEPKNPCGKSVYEIYSLLLQRTNSLGKCQVLPVQILLKFIDSRFFVDPSPLESTCSDRVHEALASVADSMGLFLSSRSISDSRGGLSVITPDLNGGCSDLAQAAFRLIPLATERRLFSSELLMDKERDEEWLKLVSMENKFLRETALLILNSAGPSSAAYGKLVKRMHGLKDKCSVWAMECRKYFHLFTSTAFQVIVTGRGNVNTYPVVEKLLDFASDPSPFLQQTNFFDWTAAVLVDGFRTAIVSVYAITKMCPAFENAADFFDFLSLEGKKKIVNSVPRPQAEEFVGMFEETFSVASENLNCDKFSSLTNWLLSTFARPPHTDVPYISEKQKTGDFSDLLNVDNSDEAWAALVENNNLVSEWIALRHSLREKVGSSVLIKSPFSPTVPGYPPMKRVYAFVFYIAAFCVSGKLEDGTPYRELLYKLLRFGADPPSVCFTGHYQCLGWTADIKHEDKNIPGLTLWAAVLLALATPNTIPQSGRTAFEEAVKSRGLPYLKDMRISMTVNPAEADKLVLSLEGTSIAELKQRTAKRLPASFYRACFDALSFIAPNNALVATKWILQVFPDPCRPVCEALDKGAKIRNSDEGRCRSFLADADSYAIMKQVSSAQVDRRRVLIRKQNNVRSLKNPENPCGMSVYEIYSHLLQHTISLQNCQVLPFRILQKFIDYRFFTDPRPLQETCDDVVEKKLMTFGGALERQSESVIVSPANLMEQLCKDWVGEAFALIPIATSTLLSSDLLTLEDNDERMKSVSRELSFLRGVALLILGSALPNHNVVKQINALREPRNCGIKCMRYFYLFTSTAFQFIIDRRHHLVTESYGILTVVLTLLRFGSNPSGFLEMPNDVQSNGVFDWTVHVRNDKHEFVEGFRTAIVSLFAISKVCPTPSTPYDVFDLFPHLVDGYLSPDQMEDAKKFATDFNNIGLTVRPGPNMKANFDSCAEFSGLGSSLYANLLSDEQNLQHGIESEIPYIAEKLKTGDFSDLLNVANSAEAWTALVLNNKLESEWIALSRLFPTETDSGVVLKSPFSPESSDPPIKRVYAFVFYIVAFYVSEILEEETPDSNDLFQNLLRFGADPPSVCFTGHDQCLGWTTDLKYEDENILGLTMWAAILLAQATPNPTPESGRTAFEEAVESRGLPYLKDMRISMTVDPAEAEKVVSLLVGTPIAELKQRTTKQLPASPFMDCFDALSSAPLKSDPVATRWILDVFPDRCWNVCKGFKKEVKKRNLDHNIFSDGPCESLLNDADSYAIMKFLASVQVEEKTEQVHQPAHIVFKPPKNRCGKSVYGIYLSFLKRKTTQILAFQILFKFIELRFFVDPPRPLISTCDEKVYAALKGFENSLKQHESELMDFKDSRRQESELMGLQDSRRYESDRTSVLADNDSNLSKDLVEKASALIPLATSRLFSSDLLLTQKGQAEWMKLVSLEHSLLRGIALFILESTLPNRKLVNEIKGLKLPPNCRKKCIRYFYLFTSTAFQLIVDRRDHLVGSTDSDGVPIVVEKLLSLASNPSSFAVNAVQSTGLFDWTVNVRNDKNEIVQGFRTAIVSVYAIYAICQTHYASYDIFDLFPHLVDGYLSPNQMDDAKKFVTNFDSRTMLFSQKEVNCGDFLSLGLSLYQNMLSHGPILNTETIQTLIPYVFGILQKGDFSDIFNSRDFRRFVLKNKNLVKERITLSQLLIAETGLSPKTFMVPPSGTAFVFLISAFYAWDKFKHDKVRNALVAQLVHFAKISPDICFVGGQEKCLAWTTKVKAPRLTVWTAILLALSTAEKYFVSHNGAQADGIEAFIVKMRESLSKDPVKAAKKLVCLCEKTPLAELRKNVGNIDSWLVTQKWPLEMNGSCP